MLQQTTVQKMLKRKNWYQKSAQYWAPTIDGVLGGYGHIHDQDIKDSEKFIKFLQQKFELGNNRVLDCGAGIGRISQHLLTKIFQITDLVEQNQIYTKQAKESLPQDKIGEIYTKGLQNFELDHKYDCVWLQWICNYLTDQDFIMLLKKSAQQLNKNGLIVIKENIASKSDIMDDDDSSVTRTDYQYKYIFQEAGLQIISQQTQTNFPQELFKVEMYALQLKQ